MVAITYSLLHFQRIINLKKLKHIIYLIIFSVLIFYTHHWDPVNHNSYEKRFTSKVLCNYKLNKIANYCLRNVTENMYIKHYYYKENIVSKS